MALLFAVGVVVLGVIGPTSAGHIWLTSAPITAALLSGRRAFLAWLAASEAALLAFSAVTAFTHPWAGVPVGGLWWALLVFSVASVSLLVALPTLELLDGLDQSLGVRAEARALAERRERDEATLRAQFELLFTQSPAALLVVDADGMVVRHNVLATRLFALDVPVRLADLLDADAVAAAARICADDGVDRPDWSEADRWDADRSGLTDAPAFDGTVAGRTARGQAVTVAARIGAIRLGGRVHALVGAVDIGERVAAEEALQAAFVEKVTLLQEVHHRVKNNLQIVSSLLGLQADRVSSVEAQQALLESARRIRTMALIHQQLYSGDTFARIEFGGYARTLVGELVAALAPGARVTLNLEPVDLALASALPCGLIVNEIVTNALKHGRAADSACVLTVVVSPGEGGVVVEVRDEGPGLSAPWRELERRSLGGRIISALVRQLRATLTVDANPGGGARFRLVAPIEAGGQGGAPTR